jgi:hypothetical protein
VAIASPCPLQRRGFQKRGAKVLSFGEVPIAIGIGEAINKFYQLIVAFKSRAPYWILKPFN